jgi:ATP-dependent protease ClpP protease subunit
MDKGKTERKWYEIDAQSGAVAEVWIYEEIGTDFWGQGLTAKKFVEDLAALDVEHIALHINSPGGSVFDGVYERKTGIDPEEIAAAMAAETWFTAAEAEAAGYVDIRAHEKSRTRWYDITS